MKIKQYLIMLLAVLAIGAVLLCTQADAATVAEGTCGNGLTWTLDDTGLLTISGAGAMEDYGPYTEPATSPTDVTGSTEVTAESTEATAPYTGGAAPWYPYREAIKTVVVSEGVTSLGNYAFCGCAAMTQITLPSTLATIGDFAFSDCTTLSQIYVSESIPEVTTPEASTEATTDATTETTVETTAPETTVPESTGAAEPVPATNELPSSLTAIGTSAFSGCTGLTYIVINEGITSIAPSTFSGCTALAEITLPVSLTSVGDNAFLGCAGLKTVHYAGDATGWAAITLGAENTELSRAYTQTVCTHTFDAGVVTKEATCGAEGETTYTCSLCQLAKTEPIPITQPHTFGALKQVDVNNHKRICDVCKFEEVSAHSWGPGVVERYATCGHTGITHYTCNDCGGTKTFTSAKLKNHTYDNSCDGTCNVCSYVRRTTHTFGTEWLSDDTTHWQVCTGCGELSEKLPHSWDAENLCVDCKLPNPHVHSFSDFWLSDDTSHWHACACGELADKADHSYGSDYLCTACGAEDPNKPEPTQPPTEPLPPMPEPPAPMDPTIIIILAAMMVSAGGLVVFLILKKKN